MLQAGTQWKSFTRALSYQTYDLTNGDQSILRTQSVSNSSFYIAFTTYSSYSTNYTQDQLINVTTDTEGLSFRNCTDLFQFPDTEVIEIAELIVGNF